MHYISNSRTTDPGFGMIYRFAQAFRLGWTGVDLFFVLSGFLIGGILLDAGTSSSYFRTFYIRRAYRILPIYYTWLAIYAVVAFLLVGGNRVLAQPPADHALPIQILVHCLFLQNLINPWQSAFSHYGVSVAWSLAVEEQFYLIAPLLVRYLSLRRLTEVLIGCVVGAPILRAVLCTQLTYGRGLAYVLMPCRSDALAMGVLAAVAWRTSAKTWLQQHSALLKGALGVFLGGALAMLKWLPGPRTNFESAYQYSWFGVLYTFLLLLVLVHPKGIVARMTRWRFLREWGRVSYCIYIIHLAILGTCHWVLLHSLPRITDWPGVLTTALAAGLTWVIGQCSFKYFEKPLIDLGHRYRYGPTLTCAVVQPSERLA
jgi:peptidoglycan/LPS O-acetylase OafA/YrhL